MMGGMTTGRLGANVGIYGLLLVLIGHARLGHGYSVNITFEPKELVVKVRQTLPVSFNVTIIEDGNQSANLDEAAFGQLSIFADDAYIAQVVNGTMEVNYQIRSLITEQRTYTFYVTGGFVGRTTVKIRGWKLPDYEQGIVAEYPVAVLRMEAMAILSTVFTITITVMIVINTFVMGLQLDWRVIIKVFKRPIAPLIGFGCQYILMPLLATGWAFALLTGVPYLQFGYFAVGCAPGGGNSNFWTLLLDGNLDLSVTMTFCSNVAALAMMPFWLYTLGQVFFAQAGGQRLSIPFANLIGSLFLLIGPVFAGIIVKHYRPQFAEKSRKLVKILSIVIIVIAIIFGSISNVYVYFLITWKNVLCGILLPWVGFGISYGVAFLLRQDARNCRTIAIETGIQNAGVAIVLLQTSLQQPEADLALVMPVCVLIFTPLPLIVALIVKSIMNRLKARKEKKEKDATAVTSNGDGKSIQANGDGVKAQEVDANGIAAIGATGNRYATENGEKHSEEEVSRKDDGFSSVNAAFDPS